MCTGNAVLSDRETVSEKVSAYDEAGRLTDMVLEDGSHMEYTYDVAVSTWHRG